MNTWFWPADRFGLKFFSRAMSSPPMQWMILKQNFFVERIMPRAVSHPLSAEEMDHYRSPQPTPEERRGVAEFPRQILAAGPWLQRLADRAPQVLRDKPVLLLWGMKDIAFGNQATLDRWKIYFPAAEVVVLSDANHYVQEDAPDQIAEAVTRWFG
jgi:haloalkane dehalogenase